MKEVRDFIATLTRAAKVSKNKTVGRQYVLGQDPVKAVKDQK
jgi:hypothetical protein